MERTSSPTTPPVAPARVPEGTTPADLRRRVVRALGNRKRLWIALCLGLVALTAVRATTTGASGPTVEDALTTVIFEHAGVSVRSASIVWLEEDGGPLSMRPVLFLGRMGEEALDDLYYAEVRQAGDTTLLDVAWVTNLSRTASAAEQPPLRSGDFAVYATRVGRRYDALVMIDLRGEPAALTEEWSALSRLRNGITNLQETGRREGFGVTRYQLLEPEGELELRFEGGRAVATWGDARVVLEPGRGAPLRGAERVEVGEQTKELPGFVPWVVDTVRNVPWVGSEPIEWLENRVFGVKDALTRAYHGVFGAPDTAEEVAEELAMPEDVSPERIAMLTVTDPELGWPPAALEPVIESPLVRGEGRWIPVVDDPYVNSYPNAPPAFYQTFLRADPERAYTRVYVTIWDPRQVQMRIQSGVREPVSATGQRGSGMVPREPRVLRRLVATFNGGFQSLHGEFGMMAEGRVYLPPKPWSATVAVYDDGRVGMGSWPAPDWRGRFYDERLANRQIPEDMVDMRQNLTSVVEDMTYNPWERWYWGAAPREADEQTYTTRSGLCLTAEGFLAYFWSQGVGPEALGEAMIRTRCVRSLHLDMNNAHCGFEFFRPIAPGEEVPPLPRRRRRRRPSEYEGRFPRTDGWRMRARRGVRTMGMPFPRFSDRDGRDFFYLTLRPLLPGPHLDGDGADGGAGVFSTAGLPHAGWPHAFARTFLGAGEDARTWLVRIDPRRAVPAPLRREDHRRALAYLTSGASLARQGAELAVYAVRHDIGWELRFGRPERDARVVVSGPPLDARPDATSAVGVDSDGFLIYAERVGDPTPLAERLRAAGVDQAIALPAETLLAFAVGERHAGVDGYSERELNEATSLGFFAEERPASEIIFPDNEPQPYRVWGYLQDQRVRYFPHREDDERPRFLRPREDQ